MIYAIISKSKIYSSENRWAFVLAVVAVLDAWILGCLAFTLSHKHAKPLGPYGGGPLHHSESPYMNPGSIYKGKKNKSDIHVYIHTHNMTPFTYCVSKEVLIIFLKCRRDQQWIYWRCSIFSRVTQIAQYVARSASCHAAPPISGWPSRRAWTSSSTTAIHAGNTFGKLN